MSGTAALYGDDWRRDMEQSPEDFLRGLLAAIELPVEPNGDCKLCGQQLPADVQEAA